MSLPHWSFPSLPLFGPLEIQPFGVLVAIGVLVGAALSWRKARSMGVDEDTHRSFVGWVLITGFVGAHLFQVLLYEPQKVLNDPLVLFRIWEGISSYGGIIGAVAGFWYFTSSRAVSRLAWGDIAAWGIVPGWLFGRAGCAIVHDHPGQLSDFPLAIDFPADAPYVVQTLGLEPGPRHDLGFYEFLYWIVLALVLFAVTRKPRPAGFALGFVALAYAPARFFLEFFRLELTDPRIMGLTPAQHASVVAFAVGALLMAAAFRHRGQEPQVMPPAHKREERPGGEGASRSGGSARAGRGKGQSKGSRSSGSSGRGSAKPRSR